MLKIITEKATMKFLYLFVLLFLSMNIFAAAQTKVNGDFHISLYQNAFDQISEFEMFTKTENQQAFFGIACTDMSPFPTVQIILLDKDILSTLSINYLEVDYEIIGNKQNSIPLTASLKSTYKNNAFSNKIRLEVSTANIKNMTAIQQRYQQLIEQLKQGISIRIHLSSEKIEEQAYHFSLKGLKELLSPHQALCR